MKTLILTTFIFFGGLQIAPTKIKVQPTTPRIYNAKAPRLEIYSPKNNQKVRGRYAIYGYAEPYAKVKVHITSTYYEKLVNQQKETITKGKGPIDRINRTYPVTANKIGYWQINDIDLTNRNWEENFTIKAIVDGRTVTVRVYDNTHPVVID